ncbi:uncharacterized protein LOC117901174 [Drosophila subobscura]|uniref:uncharacterized protein LOC117901174 n=1 Tax=Drosophila subobscura TaxID=7241 RepID=UPI00155A2B08|nr:uncharacterized protein LOC117901174 [Drosophila subobscura]
MDNSTMTSSSYTHKKFTAHKRKRETDPVQQSHTDSLMHQEQPVGIKRRQTKSLFRPWLDNDKERTTSAACPSDSGASTAKPRPRIHQEKQRRDRSLLANLLSRRAESQAYTWYRERMAMMEQQARVNLYYRQLLFSAVFQRGISAPSNQLPQQQQQFLQQMALSQQMLVFGAQR